MQNMNAFSKPQVLHIFKCCIFKILMMIVKQMGIESCQIQENQNRLTYR